jgi:hypothetical protein
VNGSVVPVLGSLAVVVLAAAVVAVAMPAVVVVVLGVVLVGVGVEAGVLVVDPEVEVCPPDGGLQFCSGSTYWLSPADPPHPDARAPAGTPTLTTAASASANRICRRPRTAPSKAGAGTQGRARALTRPERKGWTRRPEPASIRRRPYDRVLAAVTVV